MKVAIILLAIVGLCAAAAVTHHKNEQKFADKHFLEKQKFLLEIVYRVEDPLMFEEYIKFGDKFVYDKAQYYKYDFYMEKFYEAYKFGALLPKGEFFGAMVKTHFEQAFGLFNFFYYANDFTTFMKNVCWARMHVNEGMFVYALTMAVIHRDDFQGLALPAIYEIFPQYFFNSKFIYEAEKFDYDTWSKYTMYEKEYKDIYYKSYKPEAGKYYTKYFFTKDWKTYQWWKMMGLEDKFYFEDKYFMRDYSFDFNKDSKFYDMYKDVKKFYMPVDYTREFGFFNDHSVMSYFTEDLGWNAYWYYFNMDYAFFLDGKTFGLDKDRRGEFWIYTIQQFLSRYYFERLSHGFGEIPEFSFFNEYEYGYDSELIAYNGVGFTYRKNYYQYQYYYNYDMYAKVYDFFNRLNTMVETGFYKTVDGKIVDFRKPESVEYIGNYLQGNIDTYDKYFFNFYYLYSHMAFTDAEEYDFEVFPNIFLNFETMARDPFFYSFYKKFTDVYYKFKYFQTPYTYEELYYPGVTFDYVKVNELVTFFDIVDFDVTNLLNDKMTFESGQFVWDKTLMARQQRLNHKPFEFDFSVNSDKDQKVVFRVFMGPKFDEYGRTISINENRQNFWEIDQFYYTLKAGHNEFKRSSKDFYFTVEDHTTYTELYKFVMAAYEGKYDFPYDFTKPHCGFPDRLVLPQGWGKGFPMQFFFFVYPYTAEFEQYSNFDESYYCGIGSGNRFIDNKPFGYPFDREIDEYEFFVPNMYFMDAKVYHENKFEKYFEKEYEHYGFFDYSYMSY